MRTSLTAISARTLAVGALLALTACGGGSGDSGKPVKSAGDMTSSTAAAAQPSSTSTPTTESSSETSQGTGTAQPTKTPITAAAVATLAPKKAAPVKASKPKGTAAPIDLTEVKTSAGASESGASVTTQDLAETLAGKTLTYTYSASGTQHLYKQEPEGTIAASSNSASMYIDFGDGTPGDGADGGMVCMPKSPLAPFKDQLATNTHTYAKPGTYSVKVTTYFCGDSGIEEKSTTKQVTVN